MLCPRKYIEIIVNVRSKYGFARPRLNVDKFMLSHLLLASTFRCGNLSRMKLVVDADFFVQTAIDIPPHIRLENVIRKYDLSTLHRQKRRDDVIRRGLHS